METTPFEAFRPARPGGAKGSGGGQRRAGNRNGPAAKAAVAGGGGGNAGRKRIEWPRQFSSSRTTSST